MEKIIEKLVARFQSIGREHMQDLPIYNNAISVEAIDFQPVEQGWLGVLITPWFMNVMLIYKEDAPAAELGEMVLHQFPSGAHEFMVGEDDELGRYDFLTLASPLLRYKSQCAAQETGRARLQKLLTPVDESTPEAATQSVQFNSEHSSVDVTRRALLQGRVV